MNLKYTFINNKNQFDKIVKEEKKKVITPSDRNEIVSQLLENNYRNLGIAMEAPIRQRLYRQDISRRVVGVQPLPSGALSYLFSNDE